MHFQEARWSETLSESVAVGFSQEKSIASLSQRRLEASLLQRSEPVVHLQQARWSESVAIGFSREKRSLPVSEREGSGGHLGSPLANCCALPRSSLRVLQSDSLLKSVASLYHFQEALCLRALQLASLQRKVFPPCLRERGVVATIGCPWLTVAPHLTRRGALPNFMRALVFSRSTKKQGHQTQ